VDVPDIRPAWLARLFDRGPSWPRYVLRMWMISFIPSLAVGILLFIVIDALGLPSKELTPEFTGPSPAIIFVMVVFFSPAIETLLLAFGIGAISRVIHAPVAISAVSALLWGALHSSIVLPWGIVILWPFFVFSSAYQAWRPAGWSKAVGAAMAIHMLQNLLPGVLILLAGAAS
jgi:hypothetical protein